MMYGWGWADPMAVGWLHWVIFMVVAVLVLYPIGRILKRLGLSPFWSVLAFIPLVNLAALWALAVAEWPLRNGRQ